MTGLRRTRRRGPFACIVTLWALAAALPGLAPAASLDPQELLERRVKAALLYRFINYVEWPESAFPNPAAPFVIGVAGDDRLAVELTEFASGRQVSNRPLHVRRRSSTEPLRDAHLLYVSRDQAAQLPSLLRTVPANALVITEWPDGLQQGGVINFVIVNGQVRFEVSLDAAQRRGLRLSSRLLSVAHNVHPGAP